MSKIFSALSVFSVGLLLVSLYLGLRVGPYNEGYEQLLNKQQQLYSLLSQPTVNSKEQTDALKQEIDDCYAQLEPFRPRTSVHMLTGIVTTLIVVLVNSISVTYFIGTSRWCKEVADTYDLDDQFVQRSAKLKRGTFPWALLSILVVLMLAAFGAASDPGTLRTTTPSWVTPHLYMAFAGVCWIGFSFAMQANRIASNTDLIEEMLAEVRRIRQERGLEVTG